MRNKEYTKFFLDTAQELYDSKREELGLLSGSIVSSICETDPHSYFANFNLDDSLFFNPVPFNASEFFPKLFEEVKNYYEKVREVRVSVKSDNVWEALKVGYIKGFNSVSDLSGKDRYLCYYSKGYKERANKYYENLDAEEREEYRANLNNVKDYPSRMDVSRKLMVEVLQDRFFQNRIKDVIRHDMNKLGVYHREELAGKVMNNISDMEDLGLISNMHEYDRRNVAFYLDCGLENLRRMGEDVGRVERVVLEVKGKILPQ